MSNLIDRQEAIDRFNVIRPVDPKKDEYTKGIDVGIAMCIVAVKDQPTIQTVATDTNVGDTISRQAAIDALQKCQKHCIDPFDSYHIDIQDAENQLSKVPPAQPEPQKGHWIRRDCGLDVECKCSRCGYKDFVEPHDTYWFNRNFCPNCGARMKGERQK
jgi:hypothetical protein